MKRFWRKMIAAVGVGALLFAQLAVAAYACQTPDNGRAVTLASAASADEVKPCHNMDPARANLCKQHCEQASQSVDTNLHTAIDAPALPLLAIRIPTTTDLPVRIAWQEGLLARRMSPSLSILNCCFRI